MKIASCTGFGTHCVIISHHAADVVWSPFPKDRRFPMAMTKQSFQLCVYALSRHCLCPDWQMINYNAFFCRRVTVGHREFVCRRWHKEIGQFSPMFKAQEHTSVQKNTKIRPKTWFLKLNCKRWRNLPTLDYRWMDHFWMNEVYSWTGNVVSEALKQNHNPLIMIYTFSTEKHTRYMSTLIVHVFVISTLPTR